MDSAPPPNQVGSNPQVLVVPFPHLTHLVVSFGIRYEKWQQDARAAHSTRVARRLENSSTRVPRSVILILAVVEPTTLTIARAT